MNSKIPENLLPLTSEEQSLLDMYSKVRALEKLAAQARSDASKAVLARADEEFKKRENGGSDESDAGGEKAGSGVDLEMKKERKKKRKEGKAAKKFKARDGINPGDGRLASDDSSEDDIGASSDSDDNDLTTSEKERRREIKLSKLRNKVNERLKVEQKNEEDIRQQEQHRDGFIREPSKTTDSSINIKRKRDYENIDDEDKYQPSLISKMDNMSTPPHDFSKSLKMNRVYGKELFPANIISGSSNATWSPPDDAHAPDEGCLELELPDFDPSEVEEGKGNNTLAIKFSAPKDSKRFSINLAAPGHSNYYSVLFHFNPRQFEKGGQVVINDKQSGTWGQGVNVPLSTFPLMFGETSCTLIVQINGEGFDVFMNKQHCARLEHRVTLPDRKGPLMLQFPSTDDYGRTENWSVYKVWWGNKEVMASDNVSHVPGVNSHNSVHETKLFISGLPKLYTEAELDIRRAELERAFRKYGGNLGVTTICPPKSSFAFVEVESARAADLALQDKSLRQSYTINRARRSRHEALLEKRAAEAAGKQEKSGW